MLDWSQAREARLVPLRGWIRFGPSMKSTSTSKPRDVGNSAEDAWEYLQANRVVVERILDAVKPGWRTRSRTEDQMKSWLGHLVDEAQQARVLLLRQDELREQLGPAGPALSASALHKMIWYAAAPLWDDGYRREAVAAAALHVNALLQTRVRRATSRRPIW